MNLRRLQFVMMSLGDGLGTAQNVVPFETNGKMIGWRAPDPVAFTSTMRLNKDGITIVSKERGEELPAIVTRDDAMRLKRFDAEQRSAEFIASTDAVDAHGDVIDQGSWVLNHFQANPIVLYGHNSKDLPIGQATAVSVVAGKLMATIKFASAEANPMAERVWKLIQEGILRAVSVGFQPTDGRYEMRDGDEVFVWRSPILKEISVVPVPANHEALARMKTLLDTKAKATDAIAPLVDKFKQAQTGTLQHPELTPPAPPTDTKPNPGAAPQKGLGTHMDPKELADKIEKQAGIIATLEGDAKKNLERAEKADAQVVELTGKVKALETDKAALEGQTKALAGERDEQKARADKLEDEVIEREVSALVNVKITAAEKDAQIKFRKSNPQLFKELMDQRAPLNLGKEIVKDPPGAGGGSNSAADALLDEFKSDKK